MVQGRGCSAYMIELEPEDRLNIEGMGDSTRYACFHSDDVRHDSLKLEWMDEGSKCTYF